MYQIALAESQLVPTAKNPRSSAKGLFQILDGTWDEFDCDGSPLSVDANINCAKKIYAARGVADWGASKETWAGN